MRRTAFGCMGWILLLASILNAQAKSDLVSETWDAAYLSGARVGSYHTTTRQIERDGTSRLLTTLDLDLQVKRFGAVARLRAKQGSEETLDGTVTGVSMTLYVQPEIRMEGRVDGKELHIKMNGDRKDRVARWDNRVVGMYRQERLFAEKKVKPGDRFTYLSFEPTVQAVVQVSVTVKEQETVELLKGEKTLLRVEAVPDPIRVENQSPLQLPGMTLWLDSEWRVQKSETELPGLGSIVLYRTSRTEALRPSSKPSLDIGTAANIPLNRAIDRPHDARRIVYSVSYKGDDKPESLFIQDDRQQVKNVNGKQFELHVRARGQAAPARKPIKPGAEFLESSYFITCDDGKVRELAKRAIGRETDPWEKARLVEHWVHRNMKPYNASTEFSTAAEVAKKLEGDCRHHAILTAAMCRAIGVPSRTAIGLIYVDRQTGPIMGFHMWTEVSIDGEWRGLDAILGRGKVGPGHLKVTDHSWHEVQSLTPVLPVIRVVGKLAISVLQVNGED